MEAGLTVDHLSFWFKKNHPLIPSLSIKLLPGECLAVRGENGCGKSTFMRILATLLMPCQGRIQLGEMDYASPNPKLRECIGLGPGAPDSFYGELTGWQNLEFFLQLKRKRAIDCPELPAWIEALGLTPWMNQPFRQFSAGTRQKLGIVRAMAHQPSLLLLDEPDSSLDDTSTHRLWEILKGLRSKKSCVIVLASPHSDLRGFESHVLDLSPKDAQVRTC
jgi:ABC-2 type transport system ATP-binding protein